MRAKIVVEVKLVFYYHNNTWPMQRCVSKLECKLDCNDIDNEHSLAKIARYLLSLYGKSYRISLNLTRF